MYEYFGFGEALVQQILILYTCKLIRVLIRYTYVQSSQESLSVSTTSTVFFTTYLWLHYDLSCS